MNDNSALTKFDSFEIAAPSQSMFTPIPKTSNFVSNSGSRTTKHKEMLNGYMKYKHVIKKKQSLAVVN